MQQDLAQKLGELRSFRHQNGLSQIKLAKRLGISQSTVSRRERTPPQRHSDATAKLCRYAVRKIEKVRPINRRAIHKAINEVLRKSDAHAVALSEIIEAFADLCRAEGRERDEEELGDERNRTP
jgi:transcriptional regulator with XRE-family HTH domain